jgi:hypothetical protein
MFCFGACFLIFSKKNQKTSAKTSFYFAAEGGEILFTQPQRIGFRAFFRTFTKPSRFSKRGGKNRTKKQMNAD